MCHWWGGFWWLFPFFGLGMMAICFLLIFLGWLFGWPKHRDWWCWPEPARREPSSDEVAELREEIRALREEIKSLKE
jgi:hypothetical protein